MCVCVSVSCAVGLSVAYAVRLNGLPEAPEAKFCQKFLTCERVISPLPANTLVHTLQTVDKCGLDSGRGLGLLEKPFGSVVLGSLVEKFHCT